jgi:hypothetical protein
MNNTLNKILYCVTCCLLFVSVFIRLSSRGVGNSEDLSGYVQILALSDLVMMSYLVLNVSFTRRVPPLVTLVGVWTLWVVFTCSGLIRYDFRTTVIGLLEVIYGPLLFLFFYETSRRNPERCRISNAVFISLLMFCSALFFTVFRYQNMYLARGAAVLNDAYYLLLLLPWVLFLPQVVWRYAGVVLIAIVVLWSLKRTATLALVISLLVYIIAEKSRLRKGFGWGSLIGLCALVFISVQMYTFVDDQSDGLLSIRISSASDDQGSGRMYVYQEVFRLQGKSTMDEWILGHGHDTVRKFNTMQESEYLSAHNDWLEVLFDYGLPALVLYGCLHFLLLRYTFRLLATRAYLGPSMAASYALFFVISLTSHLVLYASYFGYLMAFWGLICAICERENSCLNQAGISSKRFA